ncbi:MAG: alanine--tRNA ligase [Candidatus Omnitrophota bacterium]|nr:alanine--tRNA ligase [Candidatus Omnitrophota bacterium]
MKTGEIRSEFLDFFKSKGHRIVASDSLVPANDPTLLFTGSGMNQFKEEFLGHVKDHKRAASCQKCLRTVDLEKVGHSPGHHTFFEMLGNFSFGDYFKEEAIKWAWEFLTDRLGLPSSKIWVSVYTEDQESFNIWKSKIKIPVSRIVKLGQKENFWPSEAPSEGPNGPCGPSSEIFYDRGQKTGCKKPGCNPGCDCERFIEIWNLVFTQFDRQPDGSLGELPNKCIDTGMGLERIAAVCQGVENNFQADLLKSLIDRLCEAGNLKYGRDEQKDYHLMAIADHIRAVIFLISDGVLPSNQGRGYVERMLIRRAIGHLRTLNLTGLFLYKFVPFVGGIMQDFYPEVFEQKKAISEIILAEEKRFQNTIEEGRRIQQELMDSLSRQGKKVIPGENCFRLYDTYGFPLDLIEVDAEKKGFKLDKHGFEKAMFKQREMSREGSQIQSTIFAATLAAKIKSAAKATKFVGYKKEEIEAKVVLILHDDQPVKNIKQGSQAGIILDQSPYYGESGGQIGDEGLIKKQATVVEVSDTKLIDGIIVHYGRVIKGKLALGDKVIASVDKERRLKIKRNHTATHLLQSALREVLGPQVKQRGSLVSDQKLRFDFNYFKLVTKEELDRIEDIVNQNIRCNIQVKVEHLPLTQAKKAGALALFGEKYGETVRVLSIGGLSKELCRGTHVASTSEIALFRITGESAVAAGIRRIEAVTGRAAYQLMKTEENIMSNLSQMLKSSPPKIIERIEKLLSETASYAKQIGRLKKQASSIEIKNMIGGAIDLKGAKVIIKKIEAAAAGDLKDKVDLLKEQLPSALIILGSISEGKVSLVSAATDDLVKKGLNCRDVIKELARLIGGSGGGKPDFAQAGSREPAKLASALQQAPQIVKRYLR